MFSVCSGSIMLLSYCRQFQKSDAVSMESNAVQVAVRVRPLSANETDQGSEACVDVVDSSVLLAEKQFDFEAAFPATTQQEAVYSTLVVPMLDQFFDGYNATVFAYGQTGSGKTYTMGNEFASNVASTELGVIPRVIENIFKRVSATPNPQHFVIKLSYLEILNEEIHDLLAKAMPESVVVTTGLSIRGDGDRGIIVAGLSEHIVSSVGQASKLLRAGALARATASTSMNAQSSRSHAICTIVMEHHDVQAAEGGTETRFSKFHLVDLAGSERVRRTNSEGARFKEGVNINRGLLALGNVINALCERRRTSSSTAHIPYRDSKLTRLLQDSLGGNSKTLMIACISPADVNYEETSNTLRYASRAQKIENQAVINKERSAENEVIYLKQQVEILQLQLLQQTQGMAGGPSSMGSHRPISLEEENRKLKEELLVANHAKDNVELKASNEEIEKLTKELQKQSTKRKTAKKRKQRRSYETMETLFSSSDEEDDNSADSDYVDDEDRRARRVKRKRGVSTSSNVSKSGDVMDEINELLETSAATCCSCHGKCATKACTCKSQSRICSNECSCNSEKCQNQNNEDTQDADGDSLSESRKNDETTREMDGVESPAFSSVTEIDLMSP
ncbi:Chromosome-associated kinesin KIF4 [Phytophthora citrophthora]|uniref:Kinesin-like protein n=1 Tax=Phytophthora citrophthora TaxID=4793 RepID=A0AAD9GZX2_9STRA|nr:Chromosome-associated kinesin KIF4 [Phytophthora citrophthora]